jgi:hypothetical protein
VRRAPKGSVRPLCSLRSQSLAQFGQRNVGAIGLSVKHKMPYCTHLECQFAFDGEKKRTRRRTDHVVGNDGLMGLRRIWTISHSHLDHSRDCRRGRYRVAPTIGFLVMCWPTIARGVTL